jgi:hypothetical protein
LEQAASLGQPNGWIQSFVEAGPALASLLKQLNIQSAVSAYSAQILPAPPVIPAPGSDVSGSSLLTRSIQTELIEKLTKWGA